MKSSCIFKTLWNTAHRVHTQSLSNSTSQSHERDKFYLLFVTSNVDYHSQWSDYKTKYEPPIHCENSYRQTTEQNTLKLSLLKVLYGFLTNHVYTTLGREPIQPNRILGQFERMCNSQIMTSIPISQHLEEMLNVILRWDGFKDVVSSYFCQIFSEPVSNSTWLTWLINDHLLPVVVCIAQQMEVVKSRIEK